MNCLNYMLWICLFILTGCTINLPVEEKTVSPSLDVTIEKRGEATISLRCTLMHPPLKTGKDVWQMDALEIKKGTDLLSYSFEFKAQNLASSFDHEVSASRFVLSPVSIRRESRQVSWRSEAVVLVSLTNVEKEITVVYHGDNTLGIATNFVNTVQIESWLRTVEQEDINAGKSHFGPQFRITESYFRPTGSTDEYEWVRIFRFPDGREFNPGRLVLKVGQPAESQISIPRETPPVFIFTRILILSADSTNAVVETSSGVGQEKPTITRFSVPIRDN